MADCSVKIWRPKWYRRTGWRLTALGLAIGFAVGSAAMQPGLVAGFVEPQPRPTQTVKILRPGAASAVQAVSPAMMFRRCGSSTASDCVIDGDTFRYRGEKIRIADIDAPETGGAKCESEAQLGARATDRLAELLSRGEFELTRFESRDRDQYGRLLRVVTRDGASIGQALVSEGLARRWEGRRRPWC